MQDAAYVERFWSRVVKDDGCWEWTGTHLPTGYGTFGKAYTHRFAYELEVGSIPEGYDIDHLCRNRGCCNPAHLEAVTHYENTRRAWALMTHCRRGHPFDEENTHWEVNRLGNLARRCRACSRDRARERRRKASKGRE